MRSTRPRKRTPWHVWGAAASLVPGLLLGVSAEAESQIGREVAIAEHLSDGEEYDVSLPELLEHGQDLFSAMWTAQEGGGRPQTKGTGRELADPSSPLLFPRNFNRVSAPDANSCAGCHNAPFGVAGGGGDIVANVFVLGQRFDFATFDQDDGIPTRGTLDERGEPTELQTIANSRNTLGMFGSGFIEMLARQITSDLQTIRNGLAPGESAELTSKGISYGVLSRDADGSWDTSAVEGLPSASLSTDGPDDPPNLIIRPFHQAGAVVSLREFTNNAFNHHHGIQTTERFGEGEDADQDGYVNEMTRADVTATALYQATLAVPGRVIPDDEETEEAILQGERLFSDIGCASCHTPALPLDNEGWVYTEPNPFNPAGNLQPGDAPELSVDLTSKDLPSPRLAPDKDGVVWVPAFTDLKLHDITYGEDDPNRELLNQHATPGSEAFFAGNGHFLTRKLWGTANERPYYHHGKYTTLRQAVLAHYGEADAQRVAFEALSDHEQDAVIEFLKSLQVLAPGTKALVVDEHGHPKQWPPREDQED